jgi:hypothetical protein
MFAKWLVRYTDFFYKTRYISQFSVFLISLFSILSLYDLLWSGYYNPMHVEANWNLYSLSIAFHVFTFLIFAIRFTLLFFNSKKGFWFSQTLWLIGFLGLTIYLFNMSKPEVGHQKTEYFLNISASLFSLIKLYVVLSPVWQLVALTISYFNSDEFNFNC